MYRISHFLGSAEKATEDLQAEISDLRKYLDDYNKRQQLLEERLSSNKVWIGKKSKIKIKPFIISFGQIIFRSFFKLRCNLLKMISVYVIIWLMRTVFLRSSRPFGLFTFSGLFGLHYYLVNVNSLSWSYF